MPILSRSLLVSLVVLISACASSVPLQRAQVGAITRGSDPADVDRTLAGSTPLASYELNVNGKSYLARHFNLLTGTRQEMTMICTPTCIASPITVPITAQYVVLQNLPARSMHAWGTLEELSKDADPEVSAMMPTVKKRFEEEMKKK
jgi:hypothetical protein